MRLLEEGADGDLQSVGETGERDQRWLALGALQLHQVETAAADLCGERFLGKTGGDAISPQLSREAPQEFRPLLRRVAAPAGARPGRRQGLSRHRPHR
jgi:hypothetical protein